MGKKKEKKARIEKRERSRQVGLLLSALLLICFGLLLPEKSLAAENEVNIISETQEEEAAFPEGSVSTDAGKCSLSLHMEAFPAGETQEAENISAGTQVDGNIYRADGELAAETEPVTGELITETEPEASESAIETEPETGELITGTGSEAEEAPGSGEPVSEREKGEGFVSEYPAFADDASELRNSTFYAPSITPSMVVNGRFSWLEPDKILERLNKIRLEACENGYPFVEKGTTRNLTPEDYVPLKWSYDLEEIARQRAAEASVLTEHVRTDWTSCFTAASSTGLTASAESLAWNYSGILYGISQWYEEKNHYLSQGGESTKYEVGHYKALINPAYQSVAISAFMRTGDIFYTVCQEFSRRAATSESSFEKTGALAVIVPVDAADITRLSWKSWKDKLNRGESAEFVITGYTGFIYDNYFYGRSRINSRIYDLSWTSSSSGVLAINGDGVIEGISAGTAVVTCSSGGHSVVKTVQVIVKLEQVLLKGELQEDGSRVISVVRGESLSLFEDYSPYDTTERELSWKTSSARLCTVDNRGNITGIKGGTATISCSSSVGTDRIKVTVIPKLERLTLSKTMLSYSLGKTPKSIRLTGKYLPADNYSAEETALSWSASEPSVASVDERGYVFFGTEAGSSVITASTDEGISASCRVVISRVYSGSRIETEDLSGGVPLQFDLSDPSEEESAEVFFTPELSEKDIAGITWTSSSPVLLLSADPGFSVSDYAENGSSAVSTSVSGVKKVYVRPRNPGLSAPATVTLTVFLNNQRSQVKYRITPAAGFRKDVYGCYLLYDEKGRAAKGWRRGIEGPSGEIGDYYFDSLCRMVVGEIKISGKWYSFDEQGRLITAQGLDADDGRYRDASGASVTGFQEIDGYWHYFDPSGLLQTGKVNVSKRQYCFDEEGHLITGWHEGCYYQERGNSPSSGLGVMLTGIQRLAEGSDHFRYYLTENGMLKNSLQKAGSAWYFLDGQGRASGLVLNALNETEGFALAGELTASQKNNGSLDKIRDADGTAYTGWALLGESKLYVKSGNLQSGWQNLSGGRYYFSKTDGALQTGGFKDGSSAFYSDDNGRMIAKAGMNRSGSTLSYYDPETGLPVEGLRRVSGKWYLFHKNGSIQNGSLADQASGLTLMFESGQLKQAVLSDTMTMGNSGMTQASGLYTMDSGITLCFIRGLPAFGWVSSLSGSRYFDPETGDMQEGFVTVSKKQYYLDEATGLRHGEGWDGIGGKIYYFDKNGAAQTGKRSLYCRQDDPEADLRKKYNYYFDPADAHLLTDSFVNGNWWADEYGKLR